MSTSPTKKKPEWPWSVLGLTGPTGDVKQVKRAYAAKLKVTRPDDNPEGFRNLRAAFDNAKQRIAWGEFDDDPEVEIVPSPAKADLNQHELVETVETTPEVLSHAEADEIAPDDEHDLSEPNQSPEPEFEPFPVQEEETNDEEENGWNRVWEAERQTAKLLNVDDDGDEKPASPWGEVAPDYDLSKWGEIVDNPNLDRLDYWEQFSSSLRYQVIEHLGWVYDDAKRVPPKQMSREFAQFLSERFDWCYDDNPHNTIIAEQSAFLRKAFRKAGVDMPEPQQSEAFGKANVKADANRLPFFLRWWFLMILSGLFIYFRPIIAS